jgi:hypothetical protein
MFVQGVSIDVDSVAEADDVAWVLRALTADSPFEVSCVDRTGDRHRCVFLLKRADLVVGYRSVIELQRSIDAEFDILSVERHPFHLSALKDRIS